MLYDYIIANYEKDEPIFLAELSGKSEESIREGLNIQSFFFIYLYQKLLRYKCYEEK